MAKRDFLTLLDCSPAELGALTERAAELKRAHLAGEDHRSLAGRTGALILQLSSTRTRVAFEAGMAQLGGQAIFLSPADTQTRARGAHRRHRPSAPRRWSMWL